MCESRRRRCEPTKLKSFRDSERGLTQWLFLAVAGTVLSVAFFSFPLQATPKPTKRERAKVAFDRAEKGRTALEGKSASARKLSDYQHLIAAYRRVYATSPVSAYADDALLAVAELYEEMGNNFKQPNYYRKAIETYQFLIKEYPFSKLDRDALFTIGIIYQNDLGDKQGAISTFEKVIDRYQQGPKVLAARENIAQLKRKTESTEKAAKAPSREREVSPSGQNETAEWSSTRPEDPSRFPRVTNIRHWSTSNYTRVVIDVDGEVQFDQSRLKDPDRIFFDLRGSRLSSTLLGKSFPVEDGFLKEIRAGQFQPSVVRVVLDLDKVQDYTVFPLYNPFRLVVDIRGVDVATEKTQPETKLPSGAPKRATPEVNPKEERGRTAREETQGSRTVEKETSKAEPSEKAPENSMAKPPSRTPSTRGKTTGADTKEAISPHTARPNSDGSMSLTRSFGLKIGKIVIDPGHGGHDYGTIGPTGLAEKDLALDVALRLGKLIEEKLGSQVVYTRDDDTFVPLENRTALANQKQADLFISIHGNSSHNRAASGVETFFLGIASRQDQETLDIVARENAFSERSLHDLQDVIKKITLSEKVDESKDFAASVQKSLSTQASQWNQHAKNRGVKRAHFIVLIGANMPSILTEISFLSNPNDERWLKKPGSSQKLAQSIYDGIFNYVKTLSGVKVARKMEVDP